MKDKNKIIIPIVIATILFFVVFVYAKPSKDETTTDVNIKQTTNQISDNSSSRAVLIAPETFYDFGTIQMKNGKVSYSFNIINGGGTDILLERVTTSCMCTVAYIVNKNEKIGPFGMPGHGGQVPKSNYTIRAGETLEIEAVFDPNAHGPAGIGLIERVIKLEYGNGEILNLNFKAVVTP